MTTSYLNETRATEFWLETPYINTRVIEHALVTAEGLRAYRSSPESICLQIRTRTDKQGRIANVSLSAREARALARWLNAKSTELHDRPSELRKDAEAKE